MRGIFILLLGCMLGHIAGAQKLTAEVVMQKVGTGKPFTLVLLKAGNPLPGDENLVKKMQMDHLVNLFQMEKDGKISVFGPVTTDSTLRGIIVFNSVDQEYIKKELDADPYVGGGYLKYELFGWFSIPGQKIAGGG